MPDQVAPKDKSALYLSPCAERLSELGTFEWDIKTNKVSWSDGLFRIYGLKPQEFGATLEAFMERVVTEDQPIVQQAIQAALESCGDFSCVERIHHTSGEIRYLESKGEVVVDEDGAPVQLFGICRDVTAQKKLELRVQNSKKMEAIGRLAAGVAHDFNNLLTVININSELLMAQVKSDSSVEFAAAINDAADRASKLTSQLLMFARKGRSKQAVFSVDDHVRNSLPFLTSLVGDRVEVKTDLRNDGACVKMDPSHLDQVLMNLAVNSHDAMPYGGELKINTSLTKVDETDKEADDVRAGEYVELVVQDNGVGMGAKECERAFEPFYSDNAAGGTGLGLAVVYGVVKECGGVIRLESELGVGTRCRILLPAHRPAADEKDRANEDVGVCFAGKRILVVDDDAMVLKVTQTTLARSGCEVVAAASGDEALQRLAEFSGEIDLLISDVAMPRMSGPELAQIVNERAARVPVLFMSGYEDSLVSKIDHEQLIEKPFAIPTLLRRVQQILSEADE